MRTGLAVSVSLIVMLSSDLALCQEKEKSHPAPVFKNLGKHHFPITTKSEMAQKYFNQGMILAYGFNHKEAVRSFEAAAKLDPDCAMAYWGKAFVLGPNINAPMADDAVPVAYAAVQKAVKLADRVSEREQAYIQAMAKRYSAKPLKDRSELDRAFADAMREVWKQYPDDLDAATIFAEALMDTTPWNYWDEGSRPKEVTKEVLAALEYVLEKNPNHPGANHYYIHAVEASDHPERGLPCAHRLKDLCPGAGHLVHMPAHIFLRLGMYHEASIANEKAIGADESYITQCKVQGFYPALYYSHNVHFLWYSLTMEGRSDYCIKMGKKTAAVLEKHDVSQMPYMQWLKATPLFALARFGKWHDILQLPQPDPKAVFETAMWHYGRGLAFARTRQLEKAMAEAEHLHRISKAKNIDELETDLFPGKSVIALAATILRAEVEGLRGQSAKRIELLQKAVKLQDALPYMEPPFWYFPTRQALGAALLQAWQVDRAEKVYRQDLKKHPRNGWSLFGLLQCLRATGQIEAAGEVERRFQEAWKHADVTLTASWF